MKKFFLVLMAILLASCAPKAKPKYPKLPPGAHTPPVSTPVEEQETPERQASNSLIEEGLTAFNRGLYDHSADLFQQAVTVDPSNGAGYYHLAVAKLRSGEYGEAAGLQEKAEQLLANDPSWTDRLKDLRSELNQKQPK